jgi:excisionase family DNA binding protein
LFESKKLEKELVAIEEVAQMFGVSVNVIRKSIERGELPAVKFGTLIAFRKSDIDKLFEGRQDDITKPIDERMLDRLDVMIELLTSIDNGIKTLVENGAKKINARKPISEKLREEVLKRDKYLCRYCGKKLNPKTEMIAIDHIFPVHLGGQTVLDNLATSCMKCNRKKGSYTPEQVGMKLLPLEGETCINTRRQA